MADSAKIRIESQNATQTGVEQAIAGVRGLGTATSNVMQTLRTGWLWAAGAIYGVGRALGSVMGNYADHEEASTALAAALQNHGDNAERLLLAYQKLALGIQHVTRNSDEAVMSAMALGRNMGIQTGDLGRAAVAAAGLAAKYRMDLTEAMEIIAKAGVGYTARLKRQGIVLSETMTAQEKFQALLQMGTSAFDQAKMHAQSYAGAVDQLKTAFGDLKEEIGKTVAEAGATDALRGMTGMMRMAAEPTTRKEIGVAGMEMVKKYGFRPWKFYRDLVKGDIMGPQSSLFWKASEAFGLMSPSGEELAKATEGLGPKTKVASEVMRPRKVSMEEMWMRENYGAEARGVGGIGGQPLHVIVDNQPEIE